MGVSSWSDVLIVGASLGGLRTAEALKSGGFEGSITVVGDECHMPYNRPPLSKDALSPGFSQADLMFQPKAGLVDVLWKLGRAVKSADLSNGTAKLKNGEVIAFKWIVAATGLRPRRLPIPGCAESRLVLRTLEDAAALRRHLQRGLRVVIIGAGFIGCELASSLARQGCSVTVIEPLSIPMQRALGNDLGTALLRLHCGEGTRFCLGERVVAFKSDRAGALQGVTLISGEFVEADLVIEALGGQPNVEWLEGNGLNLDDGILCDNRMVAAGSENLAVVGDVAKFPNELFGGVPRRVEHWSIPGATARRAAEHILHRRDQPLRDFAPMPTFWSDQAGVRIQSAGMPGLADRVEVNEGELTEEGLRHGGALLAYWRGDYLIGVVGVGVSPQRFAKAQSELLAVMRNRIDADANAHRSIA